MSAIGPKIAPLHPQANPAADAAKTKEAAHNLEAYLWRQVLSEVAPDQGGLLGGGFAGSTFQEMFQGAIADAMAAGGGTGLSAEIEGQLGGGVAPKQPVDAIRPIEGGFSIHRATPTMRALSSAYPSGGGALTVLPVQARRTSPFGHRPDPISGGDDFHTGLDLGAREGSPVRAAGGGKVIRASDAGTYGNLVIIDHGNGLETRYAHLQGFSVKPGDIVQPGEIVGQVGKTGRVTGPHLHFEVRRDGQPIDPSSEISGLGQP
jgi:murein DD-endopeptidase MepM/ murein hydrolase activator NlpD